MFKFGIWRLDQLRDKVLDGFLGKRKFISILLYDEVAKDRSLEMERKLYLQERVLFCFCLANGVYKRTYSNRFPEFDEFTRKTLGNYFSSRECSRPRIHDMAVSDGRNSCDFYQTLTDIFNGDFDFMASDLVPRVNVLQKTGKGLSLVLYDVDNLLQIVSPPWVFNMYKGEGRFYFVNLLVRSWFLSHGVRRLMDEYRSKTKELSKRTIELICCRFREIMEKMGNVKFVRHDLFQPMNDVFDIVRAMNVMNPHYFDEEQMAVLIGHVHQELKLGGLFVVGSNENPGTPVNGAVYIRTGKGFELLDMTNAGSPVHDVIIGYSNKTQ